MHIEFELIIMVKRIGGLRRKTRGKFKRNFFEAGKFSVSKFFQSFSEGDKVVLKANPAYQRGMYYRRFHGKTGTVVGTSGRCYLVALKDHAREKRFIVHPVHLVRANMEATLNK